MIATERYMHAYEIAKSHDLTGIDVLVACGGDGTVHETFNGYLAR